MTKRGWGEMIVDNRGEEKDDAHAGIGKEKGTSWHTIAERNATCGNQECMDKFCDELQWMEAVRRGLARLWCVVDNNCCNMMAAHPKTARSKS